MDNRHKGRYFFFKTLPKKAHFGDLWTIYQPAKLYACVFTYIWLDWTDAPCSYTTSADKSVPARTANSNSPKISHNKAKLSTSWRAQLDMKADWICLPTKMKPCALKLLRLFCSFWNNLHLLITAEFLKNGKNISSWSAIITTNLGEIRVGLMNEGGGIKVNTTHAWQLYTINMIYRLKFRFKLKCHLAMLFFLLCAVSSWGRNGSSSGVDFYGLLGSCWWVTPLIMDFSSIC